MDRDSNAINKAWELIIQAVWADDSGQLQKKLTDNPKQVFESYGVSIPDDLDVSVLENNREHLKFVVPVNPNSLSDIADEDIVELYGACPGTQLDMGT